MNKDKEPRYYIKEIEMGTSWYSSDFVSKLQEILSELGDRGWELVTTMRISSNQLLNGPDECAKGHSSYLLILEKRRSESNTKSRSTKWRYSVREMEMRSFKDISGVIQVIKNVVPDNSRCMFPDIIGCWELTAATRVSNLDFKFGNPSQRIIYYYILIFKQEVRI